MVPVEQRERHRMFWIIDVGHIRNHTIEDFCRFLDNCPLIVVIDKSTHQLGDPDPGFIKNVSDKLFVLFSGHARPADSFI